MPDAIAAPTPEPAPGASTPEPGSTPEPTFTLKPTSTPVLIPDGWDSRASDLDRICLFNLLSACADTIYFKDRHSRFIRVSRSQAEHAGAAEPGDMLGRNDYDYYTQDHASAAFEDEQEIIRTGATVADLYEQDAIPGREARIVSSTKQPLRDFDGSIIGTFGISRDVTARVVGEQELAAKTAELDRVNREMKALLELSPDPMARFDRELRYTYANPAAQLLAGAPQPDLVGHTNRELGHPEDFVREWERALREVVETGEQVELEHTVLIAGTRRFLRSRLIPEADQSGLVHHVLAVSHDLTDRKRLEDALADQAVHDPLTRLANRALLLDCLERALHRARTESSRLAVVFVDLDRFKTVNDTHGHAAGDQLLVAVAARLRHAARQGDLVARFGGDEFVLLCENIRSHADATSVAQRIVQALAAPFTIDGRLLSESASIGVAVTSEVSEASDASDASGVTDTECSAQDLLRRADTAMYQVKARHCATSDYAFFTADDEALQGVRGLSA